MKIEVELTEAEAGALHDYLHTKNNVRNTREEASYERNVNNALRKVEDAVRHAL